MTQGSALTDYIKRGWFIFPIKRGMKFPPLIADNLAGASNSAKRVASWAKIYPGCNWGLSLAKSNMLVVDVDRADGKIGQDTFDHLDLLNGWPDTYTVRSPSGGEHRYYQITEGHKHIFALGKAGFGSGIDSPNYVLLAGCTLANGSYAVINDAPLAPTPEWFWQVLDEAKRGRERVAQEPVV